MKDKKTYAGWKSAPVLTDVTGVQYTIESIDLRFGDELQLTATHVCKGWEGVGLTRTTIKFDRDKPLNGINTINWMVIGQ